MITLGLIGSSGKWAQNYIKTLTAMPVKTVLLNRLNWENAVSTKLCDGFIISTPPDSHINIANFILNYNLPVMVEKPLSLSYNEALQLEKYTAPILVNHIHLFSTAFENLKKNVENKSIDKIVSLGFNNGPIRNYSSLWDYGCHDLSMILNILNEMPQNIEVSEIKNNNGTSLFDIKLNFKNCTTESLIGNGGKKAVRKFKIYSEGLIYIYDDKARPNFHSPPLTNALNVFINAIKGQSDNRLGLDLSFKILKILEKCDNMLK